jgi:hypothetical protein
MKRSSLQERVSKFGQKSFRRLTPGATVFKTAGNLDLKSKIKLPFV